MKEQKIGFTDVSDAQRHIASVGLGIIELCFLKVSLDRLSRSPDEEARFDPRELQQLREEINNSRFFPGAKEAKSDTGP